MGAEELPTDRWTILVRHADLRNYFQRMAGKGFDITFRSMRYQILDDSSLVPAELQPQGLKPISVLQSSLDLISSIKLAFLRSIRGD